MKSESKKAKKAKGGKDKKGGKKDKKKGGKKERYGKHMRRNITKGQNFNASALIQHPKETLDKIDHHHINCVLKSSQLQNGDSHEELKAKHENEARVEKEVILSKMKEMEDRKKLKLSALEAEKKEKRQLEAQAINDQIKARNAAISST